MAGLRRWQTLGLALSIVAAGVQPTQAGVDAPRRTVFIGSVGAGYARLADPATSADLLRTGSIGLYQHANGNARLTPDQRAALRATWHLAPDGRGSVGEVGGSVVGDPGYLALFGGGYPASVNMNTLTNSGDGTGSYRAAAGEAQPGHVYAGYTTGPDLQAMRQQICAALRHGAETVAIVMTPNGGAEDLDDGFEAAPYWANVRAAALSGGGIGLDVPPTYWTLRGAPYQAFVASMIRWSARNALRSSLIVSPYAVAPDAAGHAGGCGYDPAFLQNAVALATSLRAAHALPTEWVVEEYGAAGPGCGTSNDVVAGNAPGSLNSVALTLAGPDWVSATAAGKPYPNPTCDEDKK